MLFFADLPVFLLNTSPNLTPFPVWLRLTETSNFAAT
jgi:hypothetical protein